MGDCCLTKSYTQCLKYTCIAGHQPQAHWLAGCRRARNVAEWMYENKGWTHAGMQICIFPLPLKYSPSRRKERPKSGWGQSIPLDQQTTAPWVKSGPLPAFVNKVSMEHRHAHPCIVCGCLHTTTVELNHYDKDHKAKNTSYPALHRKCLPNPTLKNKGLSSKGKRYIEVAKRICQVDSKKPCLTETR